MAPKKNNKSGGGGSRRETKHGGNKNGKKGGLSGSSFFTWFMVIALLGVWTSVAVVWFDLVDYEEVLGKLGIYDADGDGDFDVDDAKVLLGLKERSDTAQSAREDPEGLLQSGQQATARSERKSIEDEVTEKIQSILNEAIQAQQVEDKPEEKVHEPAREEQIDNDVIHEEAFEIPTRDILKDENFEGLEAETFDEGTDERDPVEEPEPVSHEYYDVEETEYEQVNPEYSEPVPEDEILKHETEDTTYQDYDRQESEHEESTQTDDRAYETLETVEAEEITGIPLEAEELSIISMEGNVAPVKEQQEEPSDT